MNLSLNKEDVNLLLPLFEKVAQQGYEQGVKDAKEQYNYPPVLTNEMLAEIFQCDYSTACTNIVKQDDFPKFKHIKARYPRDLVFKWILENTEYVEKIRRKKGVS